MTNDKWVSVDFEFSLKHLGFRAEFFDPNGDDAELPPKVAKKYEAKRDVTRVFVQSRDNVAFSAAEMLSWYLKKTGKELKDLIPAEAVKMEPFTVSVEVPINFTPNSFYIKTTKGKLDLKNLGLIVEFSASPRRHS